VKDSTDPAWTTSFILNYHFEAHQEVHNNAANLSIPHANFVLFALLLAL
jgi:hypothetical protein